MGTRARANIIRGTRKWEALERLDANGGEMSYDEWIGFVTDGRFKKYEAEVVDFLVRLNMVHIRHDRVSIMNAGLWAIGRASAQIDASLSVAAPRTPAPVRPLAKNHMVRPVVARAGSFDYARIPSLMGGQRVPHHSVVAVEVSAE